MRSAPCFNKHRNKQAIRGGRFRPRPHADALTGSQDPRDAGEWDACRITEPLGLFGVAAAFLFNTDLTLIQHRFSVKLKAHASFT